MKGDGQTSPTPRVRTRLIEGLSCRQGLPSRESVPSLDGAAGHGRLLPGFETQRGMRFIPKALGTGGSFSHAGLFEQDHEVCTPYSVPIPPLGLGAANWSSRLAATQVGRNCVPGSTRRPSLISM